MLTFLELIQHFSMDRYLNPLKNDLIRSAGPSWYLHMRGIDEFLGHC